MNDRRTETYSDTPTDKFCSSNRRRTYKLKRFEWSSLWFNGDRLKRRRLELHYSLPFVDKAKHDMLITGFPHTSKLLSLFHFNSIRFLVELYQHLKSSWSQNKDDISESSRFLLPYLRKDQHFVVWLVEWMSATRQFWILLHGLLMKSWPCQTYIILPKRRRKQLFWSLRS